MEVHLLMVHGNVIEGTNSGIVGKKKKKRQEGEGKSEFGILEFGPAREHIPHTTPPHTAACKNNSE